MGCPLRLPEYLLPEKISLRETQRSLLEDGLTPGSIEAETGFHLSNPRIRPIGGSIPHIGTTPSAWKTCQHQKLRFLPCSSPSPV